MDSLATARSIAQAFFEKGKREECPGSLEAPLSVLRALPSERGLDLAWRGEVVKTSVRSLLFVALTGREKGLTEIGLSGILSPRWNTAKLKFGAEILLRIGREFGKSIEWLLTG